MLRGCLEGGKAMREANRARLRELVSELTGSGRDLSRLPGHKTGLAAELRRQDREGEAQRIEAGAGFSLGVDAEGDVWIISGGRRERL